MNGCACIAYQSPLENVEQQQQQQQDELHSLLPLPPSVATATAGNSHGQISPAQSDHNEPHDRREVTTSAEESGERFVDEMYIDEFVWNYMLFKYAESLEGLVSEYSCSFGMRRTVGVNGKIQHILQVTAPTQDGLSLAFDAFADMVVKLADVNVTQQYVELCPKEYFDELKQELKKRSVVLMSSAYHVVGPESALVDAQCVVKAAVDEIFARKSPPFAVSIDDPGSDIFLFYIPLVGLTVHVRQGILHVL